MKKEVYTEMSTPELKEKLELESLQLSKLKMNHAVSPLENPMKIRSYKRIIARIQTELRKRDIATLKQTI